MDVGLRTMRKVDYVRLDNSADRWPIEVIFNADHSNGYILTISSNSLSSGWFNV